MKVVVFLLAAVFAFLINACDKPRPAEPELILFDFEEEDQLNAFSWKCFSRFRITDEFRSHGQGSLKFEFYPTGQVGFSTDQIIHDWGTCSGLVITAYNPQSFPVQIRLRISDAHTRGDPVKAYQTKIVVKPGVSDLTIGVGELQDSEGNSLDLSRINGFYLYKTEITDHTTLYFDHIRLVRGEGL